MNYHEEKETKWQLELKKHKISGIFRNTLFKGDHSSDAEIIIKIDENETIRNLVQRVFRNDSYSTPYADEISIKIVKPNNH